MSKEGKLFPVTSSLASVAIYTPKTWAKKFFNQNLGSVDTSHWSQISFILISYFQVGNRWYRLIGWYIQHLAEWTNIIELGCLGFPVHILASHSWNGIIMQKMPLPSWLTYSPSPGSFFFRFMTSHQVGFGFWFIVI